MTYLFQVFLSFTPVFLIIFTGFMFLAKLKSFSPNYVSSLIFFSLFFLVAPLIQIYFSPMFSVATLPIDLDKIFFTNFLIFIFIGCYQVSYIKFRSLDRKPRVVPAQNFSTKPLMAVLFLLSIIAAILSISKIILFFNDPFSSDNELSQIDIILTKSFFLLPFVGACLLIEKRDKGLFLICLMIIFLFILLLTKNPIIDRRNFLGPVYLTIVCFFYWNFLNKNSTFFVFTTLIMVIAFPLSSLLTHYMIVGLESTSSTSEIIFEHFNGLHYDAWQSIPATINFTEINGLSFGYQALGSLLFFVPRSIWVSKPVSSATLVGGYLVDYHNLWFDNISVSLPAEGYIDFGILGVVMISILLARLLSFLDSLIEYSGLMRIFSIFFAFYLFFVLRGSLLPAFAYGIAAFIGIIVIPRLINYFFVSKNK